MDKQAEVERIKQKYAERNKEIERQHRKEMARIIGGGVLQGASALPIFNIPYVGTGLGGALFEAGNAIMQSKNAKDIAKDAGKGFIIGETVGAIPYVGKAANKSFLKALRKTKTGINPLERTHQERFADDLMGSGEDDVLDLTGVFENNPTNQEMKNFIEELSNEGPLNTKSNNYLIDVPKITKNKKHIQYPKGYEKMGRKSRKEHNALLMELKKIINEAEYLKPSPNKDIKKQNVENFHYFKTNIKDGSSEFPVILDTEQFIGEGLEKPQTFHLYNFKKLK